MALVLDASSTLAWIMPSQSDANSEALFARVMLSGAVVPALWQYEISAVLSRSVAAGLLSLEIVRRFVAELETLEIKQEPSPPSMAKLISLSSEEGVTAYDAAYLEVALRTGYPLATRDHELAKAAQRRQIEVLT